MSLTVKYPDVEVQPTGQDGNAFFIIGRVKRELQRAGVPMDEVQKFQEEAMSGDYDHVLRTCMDWVTVL